MRQILFSVLTDKDLRYDFPIKFYHVLQIDNCILLIILNSIIIQQI